MTGRRTTLRRTLASRAGIFLAPLFAVLLLPAAAAGFSMYGTMRFDYASFRASTEDRSGRTSESSANDFLQRYNFGLAANIFPTLMISADYALEKDVTKSRSDGFDTKTTFMRMSPSAALTFSNPFINSSLGYSEVESKTKIQAGPWQTLLQENVNATFAVSRIQDLPTLNVLYSRTHTMDEERISTDWVNEGVSVTSRYQPFRPVELRYSGQYSAFRDNLQGTESDALAHTGRVSYSDGFFKNRVRIYTTYDMSRVRSESRTFGTGTGETLQAIIPFAGFSGGGPLGSDNFPETPSNDTLVANPLLIDGNVNAGSGVNIGYSALNTDPRNMGLDLGLETTVNILYVWTNQRLPDSIVSAYSWEIYTSSDTTPLKQWTLVQTVAPAAFGAFDNRFELRFADVTSRFIKAVVRPLASSNPVAGVDINNILVTEMQAFLATSVPAGTSISTRQETQRIEGGLNIKILNVPNLYYDLYYWQIKAEGSNVSPHTLTNSLTLSQRLSRVFSTGAAVSRTDSLESGGVDHLIFNYSAYLTAQPLGTLSHSLRVSRMTDEIRGEESSSDNVYFTTMAALYRGINVNVSLSGGDSKATDGRHTRNKTVQTGATLVPNRKMTMNLFYGRSLVSITGGESAAAVAETERTSEGASLSYTPFETLYLFYSYASSWTLSDGTYSSRPARVQTYSASWSPLLSGDLWFGLTASQVMTSADDGESTTIQPQMRWNVVKGVSLDASYERTRFKNVLFRKSESDTYFASLRFVL
jgi:hypothetical protein